MKSNTFFKNTLVILVTSLFIKILGLLNKILITNFLGESGMSLYVLSMPTIILLTSISSLSLNSVMSKLVSENVVSKNYSPKKLLKSSILITIVTSLCLIIFLLLFIHPLTSKLLNNAKLFFPILSSIILIPLVGISDALRGYFNGLKNMKVSSISTLLEQISRIVSSIVLIIITIKYNIILSVSCCVIGLAVGEIASILYTSIKLLKDKPIEFLNTKNETKVILKEAIPNTLSKLVSSFSHFLEPIIYTNFLIYLLYDQEYINSTYTIITAYVIPFITLTSFVSNAVSTSIIPGISESYVKKKYNSIHYYIDKAIIFSLIPGIFSCIIFYLFSEEYLNLLFGTTQGINIIKYSVFLTLPYYLQMPFTTTLQAIGKNKFIFILTIVLNVLKLILIMLFAINPYISVYSLIVSLIVVIFIDTITMFIMIKKITLYKMNVDDLLSILLIFILLFSLTYLLKILNIHFILITFISLIITLILTSKFNLFNIKIFKSLLSKKES